MEDKRLSEITTEKQNAINNSNNFYNNLLNENTELYNKQNAYADQYETTQNEILDKNLEFQKGLIEQQKEETRKNFKTESNKALNDYAAYINPYGYQAERIAESGLSNAGVSETSQLGAYTTYQNRVSAANKAMQDAFTSYDNDMNKAVLENDTKKAQNALTKLQMQLEYVENYYSNRWNYGSEKLSKEEQLSSDYFNRYNTVYDQIQQEKAAAEAIRQWEAEMKEKQRQFNETLKYQKQQDALQQANWEKEYALSQQKSSSSKSGSSGSSKSSSGSGVSLTGSGNDASIYGTFSNGYQPKGISGHGKLSKTGDTVVVTNKNGKQATQNVWKAEDGTLWYWDGQNMKYQKFTAAKQSSLGGGKGAYGGGGIGSR